MNSERIVKKDNNISYISPNLEITEIPVEDGFCISSFESTNNEKFYRNNEDW